MMHTNETYTIPVSMICISSLSAPYRISCARSAYVVQMQDPENVRAPNVSEAPGRRKLRAMGRPENMTRTSVRN